MSSVRLIDTIPDGLVQGLPGPYGLKVYIQQEQRI